MFRILSFFGSIVGSFVALAIISLAISNAYALGLKTVMCAPKEGNAVKELVFVIGTEAGKTQVTGLIQRAGDSLLPPIVASPISKPLALLRIILKIAKASLGFAFI